MLTLIIMGAYFLLRTQPFKADHADRVSILFCGHLPEVRIQSCAHGSLTTTELRCHRVLGFARLRFPLQLDRHWEYGVRMPACQLVWFIASTNCYLVL